MIKSVPLCKFTSYSRTTRFILGTVNGMLSSKATCTVCLDLNYNLFECLERRKGYTITSYRGVPIDNVRAAIRAGGITCTVTQQGAKVFWGDTRSGTEKASSPNFDDESDHGLFLVLERRPGKSLMVRQKYNSSWKMDVDGMGRRILLFTHEGKAAIERDKVAY